MELALTWPFGVALALMFSLALSFFVGVCFDVAVWCGVTVVGVPWRLVQSVWPRSLFALVHESWP